MIERSQLKGVVVPLVTPLHEDGVTVNTAALQQLVDRLIRQGAHGIFVGGTTGEIWALDESKLRARLSPSLGNDLDRVLTTTDLVSGENVFFCATGVTDGSMLRGVKFRGQTIETETVVMRSRTGTVRKIKTTVRDCGTRFAD